MKLKCSSDKSKEKQILNCLNALLAMRSTLIVFYITVSILDQLQPFRNAGISVQDVESIHKVSTLGLALNSKVIRDHCCSSGRSGFEFENGLSELELDNEISKVVENEVADLISNGANPDMSTEKHDLPLIAAIKKQLQGVFEKLIAAGADINQLGKDGNSAVHVCCIG